MLRMEHMIALYIIVNTKAVVGFTVVDIPSTGQEYQECAQSLCVADLERYDRRKRYDEDDNISNQAQYSDWHAESSPLAGPRQVLTRIRDDESIDSDRAIR
jgi:hypothetical protein